VDSMLASLVDFIDETNFDDLGDATVREVVRHTVDTIGCGAGGFRSTPARTVRDVVGATGGPLVASVYGESSLVLVDYAAFVNGTANRYLDFNDFGVSGHPSDMIPAVLAMAEATEATGADVVTAIVIAYEIATRLAESVPPEGGWDQGIYCSLGVAAGLAKVMKLPREQAANALSLAVVPSIPLRVTRFGELSEWKASATAHAAMTASFAARLASHGITGPGEPFDGQDGVFERVWPSLSLDFAATPDGVSAIERACIKPFPACYWVQVATDVMMRLRDRVDCDRIEAVDVATTRAAWRTTGGGRDDAAEKWRPRTRETADHSMPYLLAVALIDGVVEDQSFSEARLQDPLLCAAMDKVWIVERDDLTDRATRDRCPTEITIRLDDGSVLTDSAEVAIGHHSNPMSDAQIGEKFDRMISGVLSPDAARELADQLWNLPKLDSVEAIGRIFRQFA
jgi:2-methylcitrate dehydratase